MRRPLSSGPVFRVFAALSMLGSIIAVAAVEPAGAVPPSNDDFANAQTYFLGSSGTVSANTVDATTELGEPIASCTSSGGKSAWWRISPSSSAPIQITTLGSDFDTELSIYEGSSFADIEEVGCDQDNLDAAGTGQQSFRVVEARSFNTYWVRVSGANNSGGNVSLSMQQLPCAPVTTWRAETTGANGFAELNDALTAASQCGSFANEAFVQVAAGTHIPDEQDSFDIVTGRVTVSGGYTSDFVGAPDPVANLTVLTTGQGHVVRALDGNATLEGLTITGGSAAGFNTNQNNGGGIQSAANSLTIDNVILESNTATGAGGAIFHNGGSFTMRDSEVHNNSSDGAAIYLETTSGVKIATSTIDDNAGVFGGSVDITGSSNALITNTQLGSTAGSPLLVQDARVRVMNTIIDNNSYPSLRLLAGADVSVYNSLLTGNGSGVLIESASSELLIKNSILWDIAPPIAPGSLTGSLRFENSIVQGSGGSTNWDTAFGTDNGGNLDVDPAWVDPLNGNFRLQIGSPAIDAGDDSGVPLDLDDIDGNGITNTEKIPDLDLTARIKQADIDMGPYELGATPCQPTIFVDETAAAGGNGLTWGTAFRSLQLAIAQAESCAGVATAIWIAGGTYLPHPSDRTVRFSLPDAVQLIGGFDGSENDPSDRPSPLQTTTLSGDLNGDDNGGLPGADNSQGVVEIETERLGLLADLTIEGGNADGANGGDDTGGGIWIKAGAFVSSPSGELEMSNVRVERNSALASGGGIFAEGTVRAVDSVIARNNASAGAGIFATRGELDLTGTVVSLNVATGSGGGINAAFAASVILVDTNLSSNRAGDDGGGLYSLGADANLSGASFLLNAAIDDGGAIWSSEPLGVVSSEFAGNRADLGGAIFNTDRATVSASTFEGNSAVRAGGAIFSDSQSGTTLDLSNSILWGNTSPVGAQLRDDSPNGTEVRRSIVEGSGGSGLGWDTALGTDLGGNIDADPLFTNTNGFDFTPQAGSPAIGQADAAVLLLDAYDLDGDGDFDELTPDAGKAPRVQGNGPEIGAREVPDGLPGPTQVLAEPCVVYDSTLASDNLAGAIEGDEVRTISTTGSLPSTQGGAANCIPDGATAATFLIAADSPQRGGNFRLSQAGVVPSGGVVNIAANGLHNANTVTVPLSADGSVDIGGNAGPANAGQPLAGVRLVALAYQRLNAPSGFIPLTPCAVADSRSTQFSTGPFVGPFADGASYPAIDVVGTFPAAQGGGNTDCGVPATADAVVVNVVAVNPLGGAGRVLIGANGTTPTEGTPFAPIGMNNAAVAVVPLSGDQTLTVDIEAAAGATTNVRLVVLGYLDTEVGATFIPVNPCAAFDTRFGTDDFAGLREGGSTTTYRINSLVDDAQGGATESGSCGVPVNATGILLNLVAVNPTGGGNLQVSAAGAAPTGGVLNFAALSPSMANANAVPVELSANGEIDVFVNGGATNNGVDLVNVRGVVLGYYLDLPQPENG